VEGALGFITESKLSVEEARRGNTAELGRGLWRQGDEGGEREKCQDMEKAACRRGRGRGRPSCKRYLPGDLRSESCGLIVRRERKERRGGGADFAMGREPFWLRCFFLVFLSCFIPTKGKILSKYARMPGVRWTHLWSCGQWATERVGKEEGTF
jgi:hypothetical protein